MKSFLVLDKLQNDSDYERIGTAAFSMFHGRIGVAHGGGESAAHISSLIARGVAKIGGTAELFGCVNESRIPFLVYRYMLCAVFYVSGESLVSVYGVDGNQLSGDLKEQLQCRAESYEELLSDGGNVIEVNSDSSYFSALIAAAESLEDTGVCIVSRNADIKNILCSVINCAGGDITAKPKLFLSASGCCVSAADERGNVIKHSSLLDICNVCHLETGADLTVPFSASSTLEVIAASSGAKLKRSFDGGSEIWHNDGLFLAVELLKNMSRYGMGLCSMLERVKASAVVRKNLQCDMNIYDIADIIPCDEMVTDGKSIYARINGGQLLLTCSSMLGNYCMEAACADSETAADLAESIVQLLST